MIRLVIADDHIIVRQGISHLLKIEKSFNLVGEASNGNDAIRLILEHEPDIAILDLQMPGFGGIQITKEIQEKKMKTRTIILTMDKNVETAQNALAVGASGYLLKENAIEDLVYAIKSVARGGCFISPSIASGMMDQVSNKSPAVLTGRESQVLTLIANGLTNKKIADALGLSVKTVETHRHRIIKKLDLHNTADLVKHAISQGLLPSKD